MAGLTAKQRAFVDEYLVDLNAKQAAIRAGYSKNSAGFIGADNLTKPVIKTLVDQALAKRSEATRIDANWVLLKLGAMFDADVADIINENGAYKPVAEWPEVWRKMLSGIDIRELYERNGNINEKVGEVVKIRFIDRLKALELIGKHVGVQAFKDRDIMVPINLVFGADDVKL